MYSINILRQIKNDIIAKSWTFVSSHLFPDWDCDSSLPNTAKMSWRMTTDNLVESNLIWSIRRLELSALRRNKSRWCNILIVDFFSSVWSPSNRIRFDNVSVSSFRSILPFRKSSASREFNSPSSDISDWKFLSSISAQIK